MKGQTAIIMALMILTAVILTAVMISAVLRIEHPEDPRFKVVERFEGGCIYVDTETGIGYGRLYDSESMFVLYDTDGTIYRPNGWRDYEG